MTLLPRTSSSARSSAGLISEMSFPGTSLSSSSAFARLAFKGEGHGGKVCRGGTDGTHALPSMYLSYRACDLRLFSLFNIAREGERDGAFTTTSIGRRDFFNPELRLHYLILILFSACVCVIKWVDKMMMMHDD